MIEENKPVYPIGVVAGLLGVHPETLRIWERHGVIKPARKNKQRLYSPNDLKRLEFIKDLIEERGLNLPGVVAFLQLYPCWKLKNCPTGYHRTTQSDFAKPCWIEKGTYCHYAPEEADICKHCRFYAHCKECKKFKEVVKK